MAPSIIGQDLKITGSAVSQGEVQVDGEIEGDLQCAALMVGETAQVTGNVVAEEIVVRGKVMGSIRGTRVTLQSSSHVEGDVYHQSLAIEQGAFFEGKSRRSENPVGEAKPTANAGIGLGTTQEVKPPTTNLPSNGKAGVTVSVTPPRAEGLNQRS